MCGKKEKKKVFEAGGCGMVFLSMTGRCWEGPKDRLIVLLCCSFEALTFFCSLCFSCLPFLLILEFFWLSVRRALSASHDTLHANGTESIDGNRETRLPFRYWRILCSWHFCEVGKRSCHQLRLYKNVQEICPNPPRGKDT